MRQLHECIANPSFDGDETKNLIGLGFWNSFLYLVKNIKECPELNEADVRALMCAMDAVVDGELGPHDEAPEVAPGAMVPAVANPTDAGYPEITGAYAFEAEQKPNAKFTLKRMRQLSGIVTTEDLM